MARTVILIVTLAAILLSIAPYVAVGWFRSSARCAGTSAGGGMSRSPIDTYIPAIGLTIASSGDWLISSRG
jgi:hypothetical protein